jgi:hypothetical protein
VVEGFAASSIPFAVFVTEFVVVPSVLFTVLVDGVAGAEGVVPLADEEMLPVAPAADPFALAAADPVFLVVLSVVVGVGNPLVALPTVPVAPPTAPVAPLIAPPSWADAGCTASAIVPQRSAVIRPFRSFMLLSSLQVEFRACHARRGASI